jgi:toxin ParE1/3/4
LIKPARRSALAQADIEAALDYYLSAAPRVAGEFLNALEKAVTHIERAPGTGSLRYAHDLDLPGVRFWVVAKFPYSLFYLEREDHLLVIRLVHHSRDIPATLQT